MRAMSATNGGSRAFDLYPAWAECAYCGGKALVEPPFECPSCGASILPVTEIFIDWPGWHWPPWLRQGNQRETL